MFSAITAHLHHTENSFTFDRDIMELDNEGDVRGK